MSTAQVSIELILAGILGLCAFALPFWRGTDISNELLQSDALIGVLGAAYLLGVVFDKLADTMLEPMENFLRLKQADKFLDDNPKFERKDAFPQNKLEFMLRKAKDGRLEWMDSLKSRIRTSRELAVLGLPATMGIAIYQGLTKDCAAGHIQACSAQWIYILVVLNLLFLVIAAWRESKTPDEDTVSKNRGVRKTDDLVKDPTERGHQMEKARRQTYVDSFVYCLMVINSTVAIVVVAMLKPENSTILPFGAGGFIITLLSLWTCLRITRTYMKFVARGMSEYSPKKSKEKLE
jgi:hypothetical protein